MKENQRGVVSRSKSEKEAEAESNREGGGKSPRPPEIVFYVTWPAADVITSD